jgi:hypothetical protein
MATKKKVEEGIKKIKTDEGHTLTVIGEVDAGYLAVFNPDVVGAVVLVPKK